MFSFFRRRGALMSVVFGIILATSMWVNMSYRRIVDNDRLELARGVAKMRKMEISAAALARENKALATEVASLKSKISNHAQPVAERVSRADNHADRIVNARAESHIASHANFADERRSSKHAEDEDVPAPSSVDSCNTIAEKRAYIKKMMKVAWDGYKEYAWGYNELDPARNTFHENTLFGSNSGATIIDALDTLHLMGMKKELADARDWVATKLNMDVDKMGSVFELNIRYLGGFLSAYALTHDKLYLEKAKDIGSRLVKAFNTPSGIPNALVNLRTGNGEKFGWVHCNCAILSEMGTLQLEFDYLSVVSGDPQYKNAVDKAMNLVLKQPRANGMFPNFIDMNTGRLTSSDYRLGAMGDSFYEYLVKYWRYQGGLHEWNKERELFDDVYTSVKEHLIRKDNAGHMYIGDIAGGGLQQRMDHLACFLGGTLMMASQGTKTEEDATMYRDMAVGLTDTCHHAYERTLTGLGPDIMSFSNGNDGQAVPGSTFYWLRPETVESYFYQWRITKDTKYREWAWDAVRAIEKHCRCGAGYCGLHNVDLDGTHGANWHSTQESFFLAETLKYLYLTFAPDELLPLEDWVFNTEAHPLPVQKDRFN